MFIELARGTTIMTACSDVVCKYTMGTYYPVKNIDSQATFSPCSLKVVKGKVAPVLNMKTYGEVDVQLHFS
jgi:hypothetical protein